MSDGDGIIDATWAIAAARAADDKLGSDIVVLEVGDVFAITDHFVIVTGSNPRQVKTIVEAIEVQLKAAGGPAPVRTEGLDSLDWVLLDFATFIVHVFDPKTRDFYDLERLWRDVPKVEWRVEAGRDSGPAVPGPIGGAEGT